MNKLHQGLLVLLCALLAPAGLARAQTCSDGSDGSRTIAAGTQAVLNRYVPSPNAVTVVAAGSTLLPVDDAAAIGAATPIGAGDLLLVIQMQGAVIDGRGQTTVDGRYGDGPGGADRQGTLAGGFIAGRYEFARAAGAAMGGVLPLSTPLSNGYESSSVTNPMGPDGGGTRRYQVIRVPEFTALTVNGSVTGSPWNGRAGGVVVLDVLGALVLNDDGDPTRATIDADVIGFRGGSPVIPTSNDNIQDGIKGEGVAGTPTRVYAAVSGVSVRTPSGLFGGDTERGAPGNAGGTPVEFDSGGGGGGGFGAGGEGRVGPGGGGALLPPNRARGGIGYNDSTRLFLGGGGGSGTLDDPTPVGPVSGQGGGGIVLLRALSISGTGNVSADGDGADMQAQEGSGGGGGGGNILVSVGGATTGAVQFSADGGAGTSTNTADDAGGGGGGGGRVMVTNPAGTAVAFLATVAGGPGGLAHPSQSNRIGEAGAAGLAQVLSAPPPGLRCTEPDSDGDGVPDARDDDDDDDAILDAAETGGLFAAADPGGDHDMDGVSNWEDRQFYVTVLAMAALCPDADTNGICDSLDAGNVDADSDGVPNHLDHDSDEDGITDTFEAGGLDANGDGDPDDCVSVTVRGVCLNGAGVAITIVAPTNTDAAAMGGDTLPDYLDPDSDADGVTDAIEAHDANGNGMIGAGEAAPTGNDHDGDGIDDAFDSTCTAVGTPVGCAAAGDEITTPLAAYRDADTNGTPDWRQLCGDAYVTGAEPCDTGAASPTCSAMCLLELGEPCTMGTECDSMLCSPTTMTCALCTDTTTGGVDEGCSAATPACVASTCEACEDDQAGAAMDDGCGGTTPLCSPVTNTCRGCIDSGPGMIDLGCTGTNPVCGGAGTGTCGPCENDDPGTTLTDVDFGCGGAGEGPFCGGSAAAPVCLDCLNAGNCDDANDCTTDTCMTGACGNADRALGASCGTGDACDGGGTCVDCVNDAAAGTDSGCAGGAPFCEGPMDAPGMCVECLTSADCAALEFCNPSGTCAPGCDSDDDCTGSDVCDVSVMVCVTCIDSMTGGGLDSGCSAATPVCGGASGPGTAGMRCVECTETSHCGAGACEVTGGTCEVCVDDVAVGTDMGCMAAMPACDAAVPECVECIVDADCAGVLACSSARICEFGDTDDDGVPDDVDIDDDNDGITDTVETGGMDLSGDTDGDGVPDYTDPDAVTCDDAASDGFCDVLPVSVDLDRDGIPNHADLDADGDGIPDSTEGHDADMDGVPDTTVPASFVDGDDDGLADAYDVDDGGTTAAVQDTDGDTRPDFLDGDSDDDGIPDHREAYDADADGLQDVLRSGFDVDRDGIDDAFDVDQGGVAPPAQDRDGDGRPDYVDVDADADGIPDWRECGDPTVCPDRDGDGTPDFLDLDTDADGIVDTIEGHDADMDGDADRAAAGSDADRDGLDDAYDADSGGTVAPLQDTDADGTSDWRDPEDDEDGIPSSLECPVPSACPDTDTDGTPDYLDPDSGPSDMDMDGIPDDVECMGSVATCRDSDGDGMPDHQDPDDDDDGVPTRTECALGPLACDRDRDTRPNHLDLDSDDDGILDASECSGAVCEDRDLDGVPDLWDLDTDADGILDAIEGHDADFDGIADRTRLGTDADGDGLDDAYDPDSGGTTAPLQDTDGDAPPDWRDADDDGDGIGSSLECRDPSACPDGDTDGRPDYLDGDDRPTDTDGDGIPDVVECPPPGDPVGDPTRCPDSDGDGRPNFDDPDDDEDGIPTARESYDGDGDPTDDDTDRDGIPDYLDVDDDNDNVPTETECVSFMAGCADADGDGRPDYLDVCGDGRVSTWDDVTDWEQCDDGNDASGDGCDDTCRFEAGEGDLDMDGFLDRFECPPPASPSDPDSCPDTDEDGNPDFDDPDDDGDGVLTRDELGPGGNAFPRDTDMDGARDYLDPDDDGDSIPSADELGAGGAADPNDTDEDGNVDFLDPDDDDDGIPTLTEVRDGAALVPPSADVDEDGLENWRDPDADGDGIADGDEPGDADMNGVPDYLEVGGMPPVPGGLAGGALCAVRPAGAPIAPLAVLGGALLGLGLRRRRRLAA